MILSLEGQAGSGKSNLLYTSPLPMVVFAFDFGATRALFGSRHTLFRGIDIQFIEYPPTLHLMDLAGATKFWKRNNGWAITVYLMTPGIQVGTKVTGMAEMFNSFTALYNRAKEDPEIISIGIDTATVMRRIANSAHLQNVQRQNPDRVNLIQIEYGRPNEQVRSTYQDIQNIIEMSMVRSFSDDTPQKHLIITHHLEKVYVKKMNSKNEEVSVEVTDIQGRPIWQLEGLSETMRYVDVGLRLEPRMFDVFGQPGKKAMGVEATFIKCGYDLSRTGEKIENPTWDSLARLLNQHLDGPLKVGLRGDPPVSEASSNDQPAQ